MSPKTHRRGNNQPGPLWFKLGFPSGYVADLLQNLRVLCELGFAKDARLQPAVAWLLSKQDTSGRWKNQYAYRTYFIGVRLARQISQS